MAALRKTGRQYRIVSMTDKATKLRDLSHAALDRLALVLKSGTNGEAVAAAKLVLDRAMPVPKAGARLISQTEGASASSHLQALLDTAKRREREANATDITCLPSPPLVGVQDSELDIEQTGPQTQPDSSVG
jgi:hypothetical protein